MWFFRKGGFVSLEQTAVDAKPFDAKPFDAKPFDAKPFDEDASPAELSYNTDMPNGLDDDKTVSKRNITSILRCTSKKSSSDFLQSDPKNDSTDTGSTASHSTTSAEQEAKARARAVLITVARNPAHKKPATDPKLQDPPTRRKIEEQYSRDILKQQEKYDSPIRRHLLRFILPDDDSNSLVDQYDMSTAYGGSTTFGESTIGESTIGGSTIGGSTIGGSTIGGSTIGESTIGESTTFGESVVGESFIGESTVGESVFTLENINEGSKLDFSNIAYLSDDYPSTTTSEGAYTRKTQQWQMPKDTLRFIEDFALVLQDLVEDMSNCGAQVVKTSEDFVCGDEELKEDKGREATKKKFTRPGRSRHR
jgi:hypothetical protein